MSRINNLKNIFWFSIILRLPLLFISPISLFIDGVARYLPDSERILNGNLNFWTPPLYSFILSITDVISNPPILYFLFKFTNLIIWAFTFRESIRLLRNLKVKEKRINLIMLIFSALAWPLLLSVSILPDMLFAYLFILLANLTFKFDGSKKEILKVSITFLLLLATKPMSIIVVPSFFLLKFLTRENDPNNAKVFNNLFRKIDYKILTKFAFAVLLGTALFSPWLIKNKIQNGDFYETVQKDEYSSTLKFIGEEKFVSQSEKALAYFWEYPTKERSDNLKNSFASSTIKTLTSIYYYLNLIIFLTTTGAILFFIIKRLLISKKIKDLQALAIISFCLIFSAFYFPFFSKYNYWDTGRYSFPILILLIFFFTYFIYLKSRLMTVFFYLISALLVIFSILNTYAITYTYYKQEKEILEIKEIIESKSSDLIIKTNDAFTDESLSYFINKNITLDLSFSTNNCKTIQQTEDFYLCFNDKEILVIKKDSISRITR